MYIYVRNKQKNNAKTIAKCYTYIKNRSRQQHEKDASAFSNYSMCLSLTRDNLDVIQCNIYMYSGYICAYTSKLIVTMLNQSSRQQRHHTHTYTKYIIVSTIKINVISMWKWKRTKLVYFNSILTIQFKNMKRLNSSVTHSGECQSQFMFFFKWKNVSLENGKWKIHLNFAWRNWLV